MNGTLTVVVVGLVASYYFLAFNIPIYIIIALVSLSYMLTAVKLIKGRQDRGGGYMLIGGAIVMLFSALVTFFKG
ncbi:MULTISPECIES: hypothetical protein [Pontibacillus]|uniref:DUF3953 domain-containing protein n=1 Tax=Pontibacillus chungwhensis TaxID=265426 RepID=A0ABY8V633_9BACI|nr:MULTISPECIES: hypothetical protein [Pontibacillus]WIF99311.1 hypothetical protein QNI29_06530 [Pontibacillus chungwhensis]